MTRTIEERIEAAYRAIELNNNSLGIPTSNAIPQILQQHFCEPWLDTPDGPGLWWVREIGERDYVYRLIDTSLGICQPKAGRKWQRVIGPSE